MRAFLARVLICIHIALTAEQKWIRSENNDKN